GSQEEGKQLIDAGQIKILFIIPKGFEDAIKNGRSAQLEIILDEADPSVAQITRASTQLFVHGLSQQIQAQRIVALGQSAQQANQYLSRAETVLSSPLSRSNEPAMASIESEFRQGLYIGTQTNARLSSSVQEMKNSMGYLIDQNEVADHGNKGYGDATAVLLLLSIGDNQQSSLQQISTYLGLQGSNAEMLSSMEKMYAECRALNANAEIDRGAVRISYSLIGAASGKIEQVSAGAQEIATSSPLTLGEIKPYGNGLRGLDFLLPNILALIAFQGAAMGLGRAIAGERKDGSLTRVFLTPTSNVTIITGTLLFYVLQETIRTMLIVLAAVVFFGVVVKGSMLSVLVIVALYALGATGVGMIISVITRSQEQYMAVAMLVTLPMIFLAGVFTPLETMPAALQAVTRGLPITYAADALRGIMIKGFMLSQVVPDLAFLAGFGMVTITLSLILFRRELI
ncbi:MAG: ABC transporter permease, partial [Candidatus ainarchaeum sp.]|nr:ABC transporter permease [Candidatus ainarchaeum sp.]